MTAFKARCRQAIRAISHETTDTVSTINQPADYKAQYEMVIGEVVKAVFNVFSENKKHNSTKPEMIKKLKSQL